MLGIVLGSAMVFLNGQIDLDEQGYIKLTSHNTTTNVEGVFAAGDVADLHYRQAIVAAAAGCRAAIDVKHYISQSFCPHSYKERRKGSEYL